MVRTTAILIALSLVGEWYDHCWDVPSHRARKADWPVLVQDCWLGPAVAAPPGCRARFDFNCDGAVDLADIAIFQAEAEDWPQPRRLTRPPAR